MFDFNYQSLNPSMIDVGSFFTTPKADCVSMVSRNSLLSPNEKTIASKIADLMLKQGDSGSIINIASILGIRLGLNLTSYAAAKAALLQLTKSMALELARSNIRVNAIAPGYIRTDLNKDFFKTKKGKVYIQSIPMNRLGLEKELDGPLLLLASNASSFITGSTIVVDGGHLVNPL